MELHVLHLGEPALALIVELVDAARDARFADGLVKAERLAERPAVLERVESARRHARRGRHLVHRQVPPHPVEAGDGGARDGPRLELRPEDARAARAEDPFVAAGAEHVAAERRRGLVLDAETVYAVDAED